MLAYLRSSRIVIEQVPGVLPQSLLGKALTYLRAQWPKLVRYIENGNWVQAGSRLAEQTVGHDTK